MRAQSQAAVADSTSVSSGMTDYLELTKPNIVWLILLSTGIGFYVASEGPLAYALLFHTLLATALLAGGTGALNQWLERDIDAKMRRTQGRPLPSGRIAERPALWFGLGISFAGLAYLLAAVNLMSFAVGLATLLSYVWVYTPLKTRSPLSTFVGAFPGAAPLLLGWVAVRNEMGLEAWVLFAILFLWQFPHFYAIGRMYREDYSRAGIRMLPVIELNGDSTGRQIISYALNLLMVSLAPWVLGMAGPVYAAAAVVLGAGYLYYGVLAARRKTVAQARKLLQASVVYLPLLYVFLVADKL